MKGMSNGAIGRELGITEDTVHGILTRSYSKLGVSNRVQAAHLYESQHEK